MGRISVPKRRVFIGVRVPEHVAHAIEDVQECIEPFFEGKLTPPSNLHVTLKFLGEIDERLITQVRDALRSVQFEPVPASIDSFGTFSNRIVWAHVQGLSEIQARVDESLAHLFAPERRFMSHLTIARIKRLGNAPGLRACLKALHVNLAWDVHAIELIESSLTRAGARYSTIETYDATPDLLV